MLQNLQKVRNEVMAENLNTERGANAVIISRQAGSALAFSQE